MRRLLSIVFVVFASACGQVRVEGSPSGAASGSTPGFDTSRYPGDDSMRAWQVPRSPYRWVGYYLQSPCRRDISWTGTRGRLESMGWGLAVVYVGQQAWEAAGVRADTASLTPPACSRSLLTDARGRADADDAIARAAAEGFVSGTTIFLDLERMGAVPDSMRAYYRAWVSRLWTEGRFRPGIYAHRVNAADLYADIELIRSASPVRPPAPRWWLAGGSDFSLASAPRDVGFPFANIWQGWLNVRERWGEVALDVDVNVSDRASPSAP